MQGSEAFASRFPFLAVHPGSDVLQDRLAPIENHDVTDLEMQVLSRHPHPAAFRSFHTEDRHSLLGQPKQPEWTGRDPVVLSDRNLCDAPLSPQVQQCRVVADRRR